MPIHDRTVLWAAALCYLAGLLLGTVGLLRERRHSHRAMSVLVLIGFLAQSVGLYMRGRAVGGCPLGNTFEILQFSAWSTTCLYLLIGAVFRLSMLGYFCSTLAAALSLSSLVWPAFDATRSNAFPGGNPFVAAHAGLAMFAYGVFAMLALTSLMLIIRHHSLKSRQLGGWFAFLPPLVQLEQISVRLLAFGVVLMSIGMGVGYMYWRLDEAVVNHAKLAAVSFVWMGYLCSWLMRVRGYWVGPRLAWACVILYVAALLSLYPIDQSRHPSINNLPPVRIAP